MDTQAGGTSRVVFLADQFIVGDSSGVSEKPFIIQSGVVTMNATRVNNITAGVLQSGDGKVVFNLNNGTLIFSD